MVGTYECPEAESIFRRVLRQEKPDVVHIQHLQYWSAGFVSLAHEQGIPVVYTLHDYGLLCARDGQMRREDGEICIEAIPSRCADCITGFDLRDHPDGWRDGEKPVAAPKEFHEQAISSRLDRLRRLAAEVDLFISPSRFLRDLFVRNGFISAERIIVSDNGIRTEAITKGTPRSFPAEHLRVGYVGSIAEHKGLDVLVDAMNSIDDERISCRIWGQLRAFEEYTAQLTARISNPRTILMGPFPNERIDDVLRTLDVLVIPSLWYENSPITIHEAAVAGLPVIVTDLGGMAEYVQEGVTGLKFPAGDSEALEEKLRALLSDRGPLEGFDPLALVVQRIQDDALDMETRYRELLQRTDG